MGVAAADEVGEAPWWASAVGKSGANQVCDVFGKLRLTGVLCFKELRRCQGK